MGNCTRLLCKFEKKNYEQAQNQTATFANGCFWCSEAVFQKLQGVEKVIPGFMGGKTIDPVYAEVVTGTTGHAEAVQLEFAPEKISYRELLFVFFTTHDPTTLNRQGNDVGTQYRSVIFYHSETQKKVAEEVINELNESTFDGKIVTEISTANEFYEADESHQNYFQNHRQNPYCQVVIDPKIKKLQQVFSDKLSNV